MSKQHVDISMGDTLGGVAGFIGKTVSGVANWFTDTPGGRQAMPWIAGIGATFGVAALSKRFLGEGFFGKMLSLPLALVAGWGIFSAVNNAEASTQTASGNSHLPDTHMVHRGLTFDTATGELKASNASDPNTPIDQIILDGQNDFFENWQSLDIEEKNGAMQLSMTSDNGQTYIVREYLGDPSSSDPFAKQLSDNDAFALREFNLELVEELGTDPLIPANLDIGTHDASNVRGDAFFEKGGRMFVVDMNSSAADKTEFDNYVKNTLGAP